ncbi:pachytene checkpoint protein 2 homolog isoform X2 [Odontomachus brunneus]|uniref:pachytene checkpoint protein 2 homolog isoform X2 n=1 Tax=Odontomachus brunneus TaxID=486640 RepID=UPI0013F1A4F7|nr:pachytene checkpoint protein 2 homolog isoform X2 [Odontomachus brunneus]
MQKGITELHLEICQHVNSTLSEEDILTAVNAELSTWEEIYLDTIIYGKDCTNLLLKEHVESMVCSDYSNPKFYVYSLTQEMAATETLQNDSEEFSVASHWVLPSQEFHHIWQNLFYDNDIKNDLLHYVETTMLFSDRGVNTNIISWNKVVLLHGPPGTGKTSLCKALAQKAVIRMKGHFTHGEFIEINSHSLFSKWFSESGKLVMKLFEEIKNLVQDEKALICILIDEVESLAHARKACSNGTEPSDSIRVVNALLTQLDQIKRHRNVLILTTSNMTEAIDLAFIDRADIKQYLGFPSEVAIYQIYRSCLRELMRTGVLNHKEVCDVSELKMLGYEETSNTKNSLKLLEICRASVGLTGRALRKMPFLAHALYLTGDSISLSQFLRAMQLAVEKQKKEGLQ